MHRSKTNVVIKAIAGLSRPILLGIGLLAGTSALPGQVFRLANPVMANAKACGWDVDPGLGKLRISLPVGQVPGEVPIPVSVTMNAAFGAGQYEAVQNMAYFTQQVNFPNYATCGFGFISQQVYGSNSPVPWYLQLEDGSTYGKAEFSSHSQGSSLLAAYGVTGSPSYVVHSSGQILWTTLLATSASNLPFSHASLVNQNLPVGFTFNQIPPSSGYGQYSMAFDFVADKNLLRVYVELSNKLSLPVLWVDRWGHYVTFKWTQVSSGLPSGISSIVRVDALNQRNQGVTIRYANWNDTTSVHDLMRVDFVNFSGPAALVQGYSGYAAVAPVNFVGATGTNGHLAVNIVSPIGGMIGRPKVHQVGDPLTIPQPSWNNTGAPAGTQSALPSSNSGVATQTWNLAYDANLAEVVNLTDPMGVQATFTFGNFNLFGNPAGAGISMLRGVTQTQEVDNSSHSQSVRTRTWNRTLPASSSGAWTVACQDYWSSVGSNDSTTTLTYASPNSPLDYGNEFLLSSVLTDNSGKVWSSAQWTSGTTSSGTIGGGLDQSLSMPTAMYVSRNLEAPLNVKYAYTDSTDLQIYSITNQVSISGTFKTFLTTSNQYNNAWAMLEPNQVNQVVVTRTDPVSGATLSPTTTTNNVWDTNNRLQLLQIYLNGGSNLIHGRTNTYDNTSTSATYGKLLNWNVLHEEYSSTPSPSPITVTIGYDSDTGQPSSCTTTYQDVPSGTGTLSKTLSGFDGADRPTLITDERGVPQTVTYDLFGRSVTAVSVTPNSSSPTTPVLTTTSYTYSSDNCTTTAMLDSMTKTVTNDAFGRTIKQILPNGTTINYTYDLHGRLASTTRVASGSSASTTSSATYDLLGRILTQTNFDSSQVSMVYSVGPNGTNQSSSTMGSSTTISQVNAFGQTASVQIPSGDITTYTYNGMGKLVGLAITPANGAPQQARSFTRDGLGRLTLKKEPETGSQAFTNFNALNQATTFTENSTRSRSLQFDGLGRLRSVNGTYGGNTQSQTYTYVGPLLTATADTLTTSSQDTVSQGFTYSTGATGAFLLSEQFTKGGVNWNTSYTYTDLGEIATWTYPSGTAVTYSRDLYHRVNGISTNIDGVIIPINSNEFDGFGNRLMIPFHSGASDTLVMDSSNYARPASLTLNPVSGSAQKWTYGYASGTGWLNSTGEWSLPPDSNGRLSQAVGNNLTINYGYDGYGNNSSNQATGALPSAFNNFTFSAISPAMTNNQLLGQTISPSSGQVGAIYDGCGELTTVDTGGDVRRLADHGLGPRGTVVERHPTLNRSHRKLPVYGGGA